MDEDIKLLEELIEDYELNREIVCVKDIQAIKNLIARNKELEYKLREHICIESHEQIKQLYIPKSKVKNIIQKYYDIYEKEKEYRYTGDVEEEQNILREIEKELLQEGEE